MICYCYLEENKKHQRSITLPISLPASFNVCSVILMFCVNFVWLNSSGSPNSWNNHVKYPFFFFLLRNALNFPAKSHIFLFNRWRGDS